MSGKDVTTELPVEIGDPLAAKIRDSILGVETLRGENRRLADEIIAFSAESESRGIWGIP